jgi:hypothetical protein
MPVIFTAFAHSQERPLQTLRDENEQVHEFLSEGARRGYYRIHREPNPTPENIIKYLQAERQELILFLFSGHAGRDNLLFDDREAHAAGIAQLMGQCPNLKLVVLNGCSTEGQVAQLLALPNQPAVIATSAPVEDRAATQFSISFFQALCQDRATVNTAFAAGLAAARVVAQSPIEVTRSAEWEAGSSAPVWGLFTSSPAAGEWQLPNELNQSVPADYEPNRFLIDHLIKALTPYSPSAEQIVSSEEQGQGRRDDGEKFEVIIESLPHPIGKQFQKLFANSPTDTAAGFCNRPGTARLAQLVTTYRIAFELISFTLLSQLWNAVTGKPALKVPIPPDALPDIRCFFIREHSEERFDRVFASCRAILALLDKHGIESFVRELQNGEGLFEEESDFFHSCRLLERLEYRLAKPEKIPEDEAGPLCIPAEEELARVLGSLSFITQYDLASVKEIDVIKYRHRAVPEYKHKLVRLVQHSGGTLFPKPEVLPNCMDCASVVLQRKDDPKGPYLNLSPFLIDQNAFDPKASIDKIYHFDHYEKQADAFCFRHVYKPSDPLLVIAKQPEFRVIKEQFDSFAQLVFQQQSFQQAL